MSIVVDGITVSVVHVRHDGRSHGIYTDEMNSGESISSSELLSAIEDHLDLTEGELSGYEVDLEASDTQNAIVRPQAKFGT